ncbi:alpha-amylase family glycosyl hydrolase [Cryptosporangium phraense]|uniref:DUF3459 domain-containing protein n=1 Tax=Cryptosporangium phraense TaxID=2593070 RepID=A0A545ALK6_9ACTN|nr:alpha-amylase family glycosyl hydrolase [Cryptosporangium phraense]TQS42208.1 DUF3459 domain-containing protein [Cryptosporangium phraense]
MSGWTEHVIWWHVYPLGFLGAEKEATPAVRHRLPRLEGWLDYLVELGCNGLLLGPVFRSSTHGYDTVDHFTIDPRLGTSDDLRSLIEAASARGVRVLLDGVFNHVGRDHPLVREHPGWFTGGTFEGHDILRELNHDNPAVAAYVADVMRHWLRAGVAGWRLDAAYAVAPEFWRKTVGPVREEFPDAWFLGEMIHGDYAGYVAASGIDSVTQYELWKAIWSSLADRNLFELSWALKRHAEFAAAFVPQTFLGNHDVTRLADQVGDDRHLGHAIAVLATVPGVPSVYAGDEQAFRGRKEDRPGGDDAVRPAFPDSPDDLAPYGWPVYRLHQELFGLRRRHPWLTHGGLSAEHVANESLVYRVTGPDGQHLLVALNVGDDPLPVPGGYSAGAGTLENGSVPGHAFAVLLPG